jgi:hypothetical protein
MIGFIPRGYQTRSAFKKQKPRAGPGFRFDYTFADQRLVTAVSATDST